MVASPAVADVVSIPIPTGGWDTMSPRAAMPPENAVTLENWYPQPGYVELRKGYALHSTVNTPDTDAVETLMVWQGANDTAAMFAGMDDALYNVTAVGAGTAVASVGPFANVRFQHVNISTSGGHFLWACNGADVPVYYDGSTWADTAITVIDPTDVIGCAVHRGRLWMVLRDSITAAYLPVDSIQGAATEFELSAVFDQGGYLMAIDTWSRDGGAGPDDYLCFVSSRGQVAVYSVVDPSDPDGVYLVGVYNLGRPLGRRCTVRIGPDLAIISIDGVYSLAQASAQDRAVVARSTITSRVQSAINAAAQFAPSTFGWQAIVYPTKTMFLLNVPTTSGRFQQYVMNVLTGAWARFTGQEAHCWALMNDSLYFGQDGYVMKADAQGGDYSSDAFVADLRTAFVFYGQKGRKKRWTMIQPFIVTNGGLEVALGLDIDFRLTGLTDPLPSTLTGGSLWDLFLWDVGTWSLGDYLLDSWSSLEGIGYAASVHLKLTVPGDMTAAPGALVVQLMAINVTYEAGAVV